MPVYETSEWRGGKKTRRGRPVEVEPETVTIVPLESALRVLRVRDIRERRRVCEELRRRGLLIHERGRLTQMTRFEDPAGQVVRRRALVIRGTRESALRAIDEARARSSTVKPAASGSPTDPRRGRVIRLRRGPLTW